jgi:hypothetical protein
MDVVSLSPLSVGSLVWQPRPGEWALTVACKATYDLLPGTCRLAAHQDHINEDDNHWNDDSARSVNQPSDLAPFKACADILLVGHAFAPGGQPVRSVVTRLIVGDVDKSIEVYLDRWWSQDGLLGEGARFTRMPLRYERAAGGPTSWNPVGIRQDRVDAYGKRLVPNLQRPGMLVSDPNDAVEPIGYGPISPWWPMRRERNHAGDWSPARLARDPLPSEVERGFFNAAPPDQQVAMLRDDERLVLENLHPDHPRLATNLPGIHPRAFIERANVAEELSLACDTLWIDTDRSLCTLVWRGRFALEGPAQRGRVLIGSEGPGQRLEYTELAAKSPRRRTSESTALTPMPGVIEEGTADVAPQTSRSNHPSKAPPLPPHTPPSTAAPSTDRPAVGPLTEGVEPARRRRNLSTVALTGDALSEPPPPPTSGALPFLPASSSQPSASRPKSPQNTGLPFQPVVAGPGASQMPSQMPRQMPSQMPAPMPSQMAPSQPPAPVSAGHMPSIPAQVASPWAPPTGPTGAAADSRSDGSAMGVSNAAAASAVPWVVPARAEAVPLAEGAQRKPLRKSIAQEVIDLLWFDPDAMRALREKQEWRELLDEEEPARPAVGFDDEPPPPVPQEELDRREVFIVLTRGHLIDGEGVSEAIGHAVDHTGTFTPPLVLVSGEVFFPFDELETLKATLTAVTPLVSGDKRLQEVVDTVTELLKTPWLQSSSNVAEGQTQRLKDAFAQSGRMVSPTYLEQHTDRVLLEQRAYQKRTVLGDTYIRSLFSPFGASNQIPTYIPEALSKNLPMFQRLKMRLIAEAHGQQDQYEANPVSLKATALGRVLPITRR